MTGGTDVELRPRASTQEPPASFPHTLFVADDVTDLRSSGLLAIHVLTQAPSGTTASVPDHDAIRSCLPLARAVGVYEQIELRHSRSGHEAPPGALNVDASTTSPSTLLDSLVTDSPSGRSDPALDDVLAGKRITAVTNIPVHYRVALFNAIEERLSRVGASINVLFTSGVPNDRPWIRCDELRFEHIFLESIDLTRGKGRRLVPRGLSDHLNRVAPDIVVSGGFSPLVSGRVARWCRRRGVPFGIWSGEISSRPTARSSARRRQRQHLMRSVDFGLAYGWESARYLETLDPTVPVVIGRSTTVLPAVRHSEHATGLMELLTVSRAEHGKALDLVVGAVLALYELPVRLTVVGDGPELATLRTMAAGSDRVRFLGALPNDQVLRAYDAADAFAFPSSYDVFGLVLVEAMAAGLAVITSDAPGAVSDLAVNGSNCLVVSEPSQRAWEQAIARLAQEPELRQRLGERAARTVRGRWTLDHATDAMVAGFRLGGQVTSRGQAA